MAGPLSYQAALQPDMRGIPALRRFLDGSSVSDDGTNSYGALSLDANQALTERIRASGGADGSSVTAAAPTNVSDDGTNSRGYLSLIAGEDPNPDVTARVRDLRNTRAIIAAGNGRQPLAADNPLNGPSQELPLPVPPMPPGYVPPQKVPLLASSDQAPPPGPSDMDAQPDPLFGQGAPPGGGNGLPTVNVPLLKFAAGMLKGGHSGGFGADLGSGFEEAGTALQQQRQLEENARLRMAQQANTLAYQQGVLAVRNQHENNYGAVAQARATELQAQANNLMAKAMVGIAGHVTTAQLEQQAIDEAMKGDDTRLRLLQQARTTAAAADNAITNRIRVDNSQDQQKWMRDNRVTDAEMRQLLALKAQSEKTDPLTGKLINTPLTPEQALAKVRELRSSGGGGSQPTPPPSGSGQPSGAPSGTTPPPVRSFFQ